MRREERKRSFGKGEEKEEEEVPTAGGGTSSPAVARKHCPVAISASQLPARHACLCPSSSSSSSSSFICNGQCLRVERWTDHREYRPQPFQATCTG